MNDETLAPTSAKPQVNLLVVDLDNTLWDWVAVWVESFNALLNELHQDTGIDLEVLKKEARDVHRTRGTTEYSLLLNEMPSLRPLLKGQTYVKRFDRALHAQSSIRVHNTHLYPTVLPTLLALKAKGVRVIGYTESIQYWTERRIRTMGLDGVIDEYYSAPDHDFPNGITAKDIRTLPAEAYGLKFTKHRATPRGVFKPNASVLQQIVAENGPGTVGVAYVGDSLMKDVQMAQSLGVYDVHAAYGVAHERPGYELLREVSHWTQEDIERERTLVAGRDVTPTYVLKDRFSELLDRFEFGPPLDVEAHLKLWEKSVDVQQHFNDIGWRIRALGLTALTFALGASGFVYVNVDLKRAGHIAWMVPLVGLLLWLAFWFMDAAWFHRLLKGAVGEGARLERLLSSIGIRVGLGAHISDASPLRVRRVRFLRRLQLHSTGKLHVFYSIISAGLLAALLTLFLLPIPTSQAQPQSDSTSGAAVRPSTRATSAPTETRQTARTPKVRPTTRAGL